MVISITDRIDNSWANGEQDASINEDMFTSVMVAWEEEGKEEQEYNKTDFERDFRKVSRRVKK